MDLTCLSGRPPHQTLKRLWWFALLGIWTAAGLMSAGYDVHADQRPQAVIRVGGNENFAPYEFVNANGEPDGYTVALMQAVARQLGVPVEITLGPWQEMVNKLKSGEIDALSGVLYSETRDQFMDFSVPHIIISYAIFVRRHEPYRSVEDLRDKEVIVVNGVYAHDWLRENEFARKIVAVSGPREALQLLSDGKHDFAVLPRLHGLEMVRRMKIDNVETVGPPVLSQKFCFAVSTGNSDLLADLNEGLVSLQKSGDYDQIYLKWFSLYEQKQRYWHYIIRGGGLILGLVLLVVFWNLTLKRRVAARTQALQKSRTLLNQIVQGLPMPTFVVNRDNLVTHWNKACEAFTGVPAEQIVGTQDHPKVFYRQQRQPLSRLLLTAQTQDRTPEPLDCAASVMGDGACEAEFHFRSNEGESKWFYGTAALLHDSEGGVVGAIESWQDLTEYKRMEAQLLQAQKMEAIGTLAGGIAHDFNNMLTAIMAYAELAKRTSAPTHAKDHPIDKLLEVCDHARRLIRRLLTFSRQTEVEIKPVHIDTLVNDAIELIRATLPSAMQIVSNINSNALVVVDATQLHQVLMNLSANAAHAMGGKKGTLTIKLDTVDPASGLLPDEVEKARGAFVKLSVTDTGHGIPEEILDRIFDPFFSTKKREEGTGMGLAVSHGIVKRFGGAITVESRLGHGTTFNVFLPVIADEAELAPFTIDSMPKGKEHLIIVGQNTTPLGNLMTSLETLGYRLTRFESGQDMLAALEAGADGHDLMILAGPPSDPEQETLIQAVRNARPGLPIIMATGYVSEVAEALASRLGVEAVIHEPIIVGELAALLRRLLAAEMAV